MTLKAVEEAIQEARRRGERVRIELQRRIDTITIKLEIMKRAAR